jgi:hypothetical protein
MDDDENFVVDACWAVGDDNDEFDSKPDDADVDTQGATIAAQRDKWITHVSRPVKEHMCGPITKVVVSDGKVDITGTNKTPDDVLIRRIQVTRRGEELSFAVKHGAEVYRLQNGTLEKHLCVIKSFFRTPTKTFPPVTGIRNDDHPAYCVSVYPLYTIAEARSKIEASAAWASKQGNRLSKFDRILDYTVELGVTSESQELETLIPIQWLIRPANVFKDPLGGDQEGRKYSSGSSSQNIVLRHAFAGNTYQPLDKWKDRVAFCKL